MPVESLGQVLILLTVSVLLVSAGSRIGLPPLLGYLIVGILLGPFAFAVLPNGSQTRAMADIGVVFLLFTLGLEFSFPRMVAMRREVFGLGSAQTLIVGGAGVVAAHAFGISWPSATVIGGALSMCSTAIVLKQLGDQDEINRTHGRLSFAVLLFQDLAFIPLVALVPLLAGHAMPEHVPWWDVARAAAAIVAILVGGRFLMRPLFHAIGGARTPELFTTVALLIVTGTALLASAAGLSPSLGAFMAGVLLSGSEYRHELEADIAPFEGLLLGFFFISVGMSADLGLARTAPLLLLGGTAGLLGAKVVILYGLARAAQQDGVNALRFALALPQASEFSFVLFGAAVAVGALDPQDSRMATLVAAASMLATPILFAGAEAWVIPRLRPLVKPEYDKIEGEANPVIIAGFGRMGQIVGRVLRLHGIAFTALERNQGQVDVVRRFGAKVYFGDPTRAEVLRAAGAAGAKLLVVLLDDMAAVLRTVEVAKRNFPQLKILARARNRRHAHLLMDRGVDGLVRETFFSSLVLAEQALTALGIDADAASRAVALFRDHDERTLVASHAIYRDEQKLIQTTQDAAAELESLFEADRER